MEEKRIADLEKTVASILEYMKVVNKAVSEGFSKADGNFDKITSRFQTVEGELKIINAKIDKLAGNTDTGFSKVDVQLEDLKSEVSKIGSVTGYDDMINNLKIVNK